MIVEYIDAHKARFGVDPICRVLTEHGMQIAPSTYYARKQAGQVPESVLAEAYEAHAVYQVWERNRSVYGVRKMWHAMDRAGVRMGRDQVGRLMGICGAAGAVRGQHRTTTTTRDDRAPRFPDHVDRQWDRPDAPDQLWVADFTYVATWSGFVYVAFVIDVYARCIVGWRVATSMKTGLVLDALEQALWARKHRQGLIHHSDRGSQYLSIRYTERMADEGIDASVGTTGDSYDNALAETLIGLFKTEVIHHRGPWKGRDAVEYATLEWVDWFNNRRLLEPIGNVPPAEREKAYYRQLEESGEAA